MPNGADRNWIRVLAAVDGFFATHGHWPSRVRLPRPALENLQNDLFTPASWQRLTERIEFIPDESAGMIAEDESGNVYNFGRQGFPRSRPALPADEWLSVSPDAPHAYDE